MKTSVKSASTTPVSTQSYEGLYMRNNLNCTGALPATGQFAQCPDIVGTAQLLQQPAILATPTSWDEMYDVLPTPGGPFYYYLRGKCGGSAEAQAQTSLYYAPASLLLHPAVWQNNQLSTKSGEQTVNLVAEPGKIAVGPVPFVWPVNSNLNASFYSFVAQVTSDDLPNPIPTITSWSDMNALLQNLGFGFRTTYHFDGSDFNWSTSVNFSVPEGISDPGELTFTIATQGLSGCTVTMISPVVLPNGNTLQYGPQPISSSSFQGSVEAAIPTGYSCLLNLSLYNAAGTPPASGSTLTLSVGYMTTPSDAHFGSEVVPIQQFVLLGECTFTVE